MQEDQFYNSIIELQLGKLLHKANIIKNCDVSAYEIFQIYLINLQDRSV